MNKKKVEILLTIEVDKKFDNDRIKEELTGLFNSQDVNVIIKSIKDEN